MSWRVVITGTAQRDMRDVIRESRRQFGPVQAERYKALLKHAFRSLQDGPEVAGSRGRDDLLQGLRTVQIARIGKRASHLLAYAARGDRLIVVFRILHEHMDLARHLGINEGSDS